MTSNLMILRHTYRKEILKKVQLQFSNDEIRIECYIRGTPFSKTEQGYDIETMDRVIDRALSTPQLYTTYLFTQNTSSNRKNRRNR